MHVLCYRQSLNSQKLIIISVFLILASAALYTSGSQTLCGQRKVKSKTNSRPVFMFAENRLSGRRSVTIVLLSMCMLLCSKHVTAIHSLTRHFHTFKQMFPLDMVEIPSSLTGGGVSSGREFLVCRYSFSIFFIPSHQIADSFLSNF